MNFIKKIYSKVLSKVAFLKDFANFTGKHQSQRLLLINVQAKNLQNSGTSVFLWIPQNSSGELFLK